MDSVERTLIIVKPDAVQRGLIGEVLQRLERRGLRFAGLKLMQISRELAERHYEEHKTKPFYADLVQFISSGPVVVGVVEGPNAIAATRASAGGTDPKTATNPLTATPGSIRADFGLTIGRNIIHASDSTTSAQREIGLFFTPDELVAYQRAIDAWITES